MQKLTKEQKKEIKGVLKKYTTRGQRAHVEDSMIGAIDGFFTGMLVALAGGVFLTGAASPALSYLVISAGSAAGIGFGQYKARKKPDVWANRAGQEVKTTRAVWLALLGMEDKFEKSFQQAAAKTHSYTEFQNIATEIEADVKKLSPAFQIVSGGPHRLGTENFEFFSKIGIMNAEQNKVSAVSHPPATPAMLKIM